MIASKSKIIENARQQGRTTLTEIESKLLFADAGFQVVETKQAASKQEAVALSDEIGYPVVLKVDSADISHKSDAGGVKVDLKDSEEVEVAYDEIMASAKKAFPDAKVDGVSVQSMARPGIEIIMGMFKDVQFGPVLMFGLGGILVEVLKDVAFRIVPLAKRDASEMIKEIKGHKLLDGYRGQEPANIPYLEEMLLKLSEFVDKTPEIKEIDFNPVFAYQDGAVVVDARTGLEEK
jgi:acyl-CoA synthetase (NDP forming)